MTSGEHNIHQSDASISSDHESRQVVEVLDEILEDAINWGAIFKNLKSKSSSFRPPKPGGWPDVKKMPHSPSGSNFKPRVPSKLPWIPSWKKIQESIEKKFPKSPEPTEKKPESTKASEKNPESTEATEKNPESTEATEKNPESTEATEKNPESTEATEKNPESTEATEKNPESTEATEKNPESTEATEKNPESTEATEKKPESTEATEKKPESTEATEKNPESTEATEKKPESNEATEKKPQSPKATEKKPCSWKGCSVVPSKGKKIMAKTMTGTMSKGAPRRPVAESGKENKETVNAGRYKKIPLSEQENTKCEMQERKIRGRVKKVKVCFKVTTEVGMAMG